MNGRGILFLHGSVLKKNALNCWIQRGHIRTMALQACNKARRSSTLQSGLACGYGVAVLLVLAA